MNFSTHFEALSINLLTLFIGTDISCLMDPPSGFCASFKPSLKTQSSFLCCELSAITPSKTIFLLKANSKRSSICFLKLFLEEEENSKSTYHLYLSLIGSLAPDTCLITISIPILLTSS